MQENGTQSTFGIPLVVACIPGYRQNGSESNANVNISTQCNENGIFDITPSCEPKGNGMEYMASVLYSLKKNLEFEYNYIVIPIRPSFRPFVRPSFHLLSLKVFYIGIFYPYIILRM